MDSLDEGGDPLNLLYFSCIPWVKYTQILQPTPVPADSNPRVTWGSYRDGMMPVTLVVNHALADGVHIARFFSELEREMNELLQKLN